MVIYEPTQTTPYHFQTAVRVKNKNDKQMKTARERKDENQRRTLKQRLDKEVLKKGALDSAIKAGVYSKRSKKEEHDEVLVKYLQYSKVNKSLQMMSQMTRSQALYNSQSDGVFDKGNLKYGTIGHNITADMLEYYDED